MSPIYKFHFGYEPKYSGERDTLESLFSHVDSYSVDGYDGLHMLICGNDNPDDIRVFYMTDDYSVLEAYANAVNDEVYGCCEEMSDL